MLNKLPFYAKWRVNAGGIVTFSDQATASGTVLVAYLIKHETIGDYLALQLVCDEPGAKVPGDLPFIQFFPTGSTFAVMDARGKYPSAFTTIIAVTLAKPLQLLSDNTSGVLGYWPKDGGFGWNLRTEPVGAAAYSVELHAASAASLRAGIAGTTTDYSWTSLNDEDYSNLKLPGANFSFADLTNTKLSGTSMDGANFTGVNLTGKDFTGCSLQNVDFTKAVSIAGANFGGVNLSGANFSGLDLTGIELGGTQLAGAQFNGCDLTKAKFSSPPTFSSSAATLTGFASATLDYSLIGLTWSYFDLSNAKIVGLPSNLAGLQALSANLTGLSLNGMTITGANFDNATLQSVVFDGSNLSSSTFVSAQLQGNETTLPATLTKCSLVNVDFSGANLTNVEMTDAYFHGDLASFRDATIKQANFADSYLTGVDFSAVSGSDFQGVKFTNACLVNTIFRSCVIRDSAGSFTSFAGACLQGADFSGANIGACDFSNAAVAATAGTINVTLPVSPTPVPISYNQTLGLTAATHTNTVCPNASRGPCTASQLIGPNPPTTWPSSSSSVTAVDATLPAPADASKATA